MGRFIFVDTSAWVATFVEKDEHHAVAARFLPAGLRAHRRFLTTDYVFDETVTRVRYQGGHQEAVRTGEAILASESVTLIEIDARLRDQAWKLFKRYRDQPLSFTDCASAALMEKYGLAEIFTFDRGFQKIGFTLMPASGGR